MAVFTSNTTLHSPIFFIFPAVAIALDDLNTPTTYSTVGPINPLPTILFCSRDIKKVSGPLLNQLSIAYS